MSHIVDGGRARSIPALIIRHLLITVLGSQQPPSRRGCRDLAQQAATLSAEVKKLQATTKDAVPLEVRESSVYGAECHVQPSLTVGR